MKRLLIAVVLLLFLIAAAGCSGGSDLYLEITTAVPETDGIGGLYLSTNAFKGTVNNKFGYEIATEHPQIETTKTVVFAGQTFQLSFFDRETTRKHSEDSVIDDQNNIVNAGKLLRSYDSYKGTMGEIRMRAAFTGSENRPNLVEVSGDGVLVLSNKTEEQLKSMIENWLFGTFVMNTDGMTYSIVSLSPSGSTEGFIPGAEQYVVTYTELLGEITVRYAAVTLRENQVALLVRDHYTELKTSGGRMKTFAEKIASLKKDDLVKILSDKVKAENKEITSVTVSLTGTPIFDVCDDFVYIEFDAKVSYRLKGVAGSERIGVLLTVDQL